MKTLRGVAIVSALLAAYPAAHAAKIETISSGSLTVITVEGELQTGDDDTFKDKVLRLREAAVLFNSKGGNLVAGIEIGRAIRLKGFDTIVPDDMLCASACALAWLGGKTRWASPKAQIAFHAAWILKEGQKVETGPGNALVGAYLHSLGLSDNAILFITSAPPDGAEIFSFAKADTLGIAVKRFEVPPESHQEDARQKLSTPQKTTEPDASYYDPNVSTIRPQRSAPPQPAETRTSALPPALAPNQYKWRPEDPEMQPQVLDLTDLQAAAQVQRRLQERGFFLGQVDGVWGPRSRIALRDFKTRNNLGTNDGWDLKTQLALFDDRYQVAAATYIPPSPDQDNLGLFTPFAAIGGTTLHPLNPADAAKIQERLFQLKYYRKQGDGIWGLASRTALTVFKISNGLPATDTWDRDTEETIRGPRAVPATETPFGEWVQIGTSCSYPANPSRLIVSSRQIAAGSAACPLDSPLRREADGWRSTGTCTRGSISAPVRIHLQLSGERLLDRSVVGATPNLKPVSFERCP